VAIPSPEFSFLQGIAEKNKVFISVGIVEKDGGTLYCTALLIGKDGSLLSRHRKVYKSSTPKPLPTVNQQSNS
jgi:predicted amidohydrolase